MASSSARRVAGYLVIVLSLFSGCSTTSSPKVSPTAIDPKALSELEFNSENSETWYTLRERFPGTVQQPGSFAFFVNREPTLVKNGTSITLKDGSDQRLLSILVTSRDGKTVIPAALEARQGFTGTVYGFHTGDDPKGILSKFSTAKVDDNKPDTGLITFRNGWSFGWWNDDHGHIKIMTLVNNHIAFDPKSQELTDDPVFDYLNR